MFDNYIKKQLLLILISLACVEVLHSMIFDDSRGSDDLYAFQLFGFHDHKIIRQSHRVFMSRLMALSENKINKIKALYKLMSLKFHPDLYHGPEKDKIFTIISSAYTVLINYANSKQISDLYSVVPNSKEIFYRYIKPYLDDIRNMVKFNNIVSAHNKLKTALAHLKQPLNFKLKNINDAIKDLNQLLKEANHYLKSITTDLTAIKNHPYITLEPLKAKLFLNKVQQFKPISKAKMTRLLKQIKDQIDELNAILKLYRPIKFLEELIKGNPDAKKGIEELITTDVTVNPQLIKKMLQPLNISEIFNFVDILIKNHAMTNQGEIKSYESAFSHLLEYLHQFKTNLPLRGDNDQKNSLLKEIHQKEAFYIHALNALQAPHILSTLTISLMSLADKKV